MLINELSPISQIEQLSPLKESPTHAHENAGGEGLVTTGISEKKDSVELSDEGKKAAQTQVEEELTPEEKQVVKELQQRDRVVRAHEAAHMAAAGGTAKGGASFSYQTGPDGKQYAIGGEVSIDMSHNTGDPDATIAKMAQVRAAALAPADPSGQDQSVAARASQVSANAQREKARQNQEQLQGGEKSKENGNNSQNSPHLRAYQQAQEQSKGTQVDFAA